MIDIGAVFERSLLSGIMGGLLTWTISRRAYSYLLPVVAGSMSIFTSVSFLHQFQDSAMAITGFFGALTILTSRNTEDGLLNGTVVWLAGVIGFITGDGAFLIAIAVTFIGWCGFKFFPEVEIDKVIVLPLKGDGEKGRINAGRFLLRVFAYGSCVAVILVGMLGSYVLYLRFTDNFHVVMAGSLYRSAQPSDADLRHYARDWGMKSVINLRDSQPGGNAWHDDEMKTAAELGLSYIHCPLPTKRPLSVSEIESVITALEQAPKPILIHSYLGSDRVGLVSAMYLFAIARKPFNEAKSQLSFFYGHLPYLGNPTIAMDKTFVSFANFRGQ